MNIQFYNYKQLFFQPLGYYLIALRLSPNGKMFKPYRPCN